MTHAGHPGHYAHVTRREIRRLAWVGLVLSLLVLGWAFLVGYQDTVPMLASNISVTGQSPNPAGQQTFSCPALRKDAAEYFWAEVYPERRPCDEGRSSREQTARVALGMAVLSAAVIVGEQLTRSRATLQAAAP